VRLARFRWSAAGVCLFALLASACTPGSGGGPGPQNSGTRPAASNSASQAASPGEPITLHVLAGSEVKDMTGVVEEAAKATNVRLTFDFTGTLDGSQAVAAGKAAGKYDAIWFPSNRYLSMTPGASKRLGASTKIMASPVVLGVQRRVARKLGWDREAPTWRDIAEAAEAKKFTYGMTDPSASNSGFSALVGVASALSGGGAALGAKQAIDVAPDLRRFFSGQTMTSGSSGWLADQFIKQSGKRDSPDGLVNYESVLLGLNAEGKLKEPLTVVIPADGVVTADYPLTLLSGADERTRDAYTAVTEWLRGPVAQKMIMDETSRRPAVPGVKLDTRFGDQLLVELPFPAQRAVADNLITSYLNTIRRASQTIYVLDLSGSMQGPRIEALRSALVSLAGGQSSTDSRDFTSFRKRETVSLLGYSDNPRRPQVFSIPAGGSGKVLAEIRDAARDLELGGNTATYDALRSAYRLAAKQTAARPGALTTIVLMTDGETNLGWSAAQFRSYYRDLPSAARSVPTFTVKFGPADPTALTAVSELTGGKLFVVRDNRLAAAFKEIRAYQ
jgi:Ca-activated chloride channel family protein